MADGAEGNDCPDKNFSDSDSSNESIDFKADPGFSSEDQKSLRDPKLAASKLYNGKKKQKAIAKQEWERRFHYLSFKHFLRYTRAINDRKTDGGVSPRKNKKREEESDGLFADDEGYLQGEIYNQLENGEETGFTGDVSRKLNLTSKDAELLRTDFQSDNDNPEVTVVPCEQFVREISSEN